MNENVSSETVNKLSSEASINQNDNLKTPTNKELLKDGFQFEFHCDGHLIEAWGSAKSGKENIKLNGELVSEKRNLRRKSLHSFQVGDALYEIEFNTASIKTGELHCTLIKEGVHVETQKQIPLSNSSKKEFWKEFWKGFTIAFAVGALGGFLGMTLILQYFDK